MEELRNLLKEKYPNIDFNSEKNLVSDGILDSIEVVSIIAEIEELYDIEISMEYIQPMYFESIESMWGMVEEII